MRPDRSSCYRISDSTRHHSFAELPRTFLCRGIGAAIRPDCHSRTMAGVSTSVSIITLEVSQISRASTDP